MIAEFIMHCSSLGCGHLLVPWYMVGCSGVVIDPLLWGCLGTILCWGRGGSLPASSWAPRGLGFCQEDWPLAGPLPIASGSLGLSPFGLG